MGKLIFADSLSNFVNKVPNWGVSTDPSYYSIAFTSDGYLVTHGKQFALTLVDKLEDLVTLNLSESGKTIYLTGKNVSTNLINLPVYKVQSDENNPVVSNNTDGVVTVNHREASEIDTTGIEYSGGFDATNYTINLPKLKIDSFGHIAECSVAGPISINFVKQTLSTNTTDKFSLLGTTASETSNAGAVFNKDLYYLGGTLYVSTINEDGTTLYNKYVRASEVGTQDGKSYYAQESYGGIVKLSDSIESDLNTKDGKTAATPAAVKAAVAKALTDAKALFASNDAMIFMGTIKPDGTIISHNTNVATLNGLTITNNTTKISSLTHFEAGWTFKFAFEGAEQTFTLGSKSWVVEQGDMLVCTSTGKSATAASFDVVQANIENQVTASTVSLSKGILVATGNGRTVESLGTGTAGQVVTFDGSDIVWGDISNTWRPIKVNGTDVLTSNTTSGLLEFKNGTGVEVSYADNVITIKNTSPLSSASSLSFMNNADNLGSYNPSSSTNPTIKFGGNIIQGGYDSGIITVEHKTSGIGAKTEGLYTLAIDAYGHITKATAISNISNALAKNLKFTVGSNSITFDNQNDREIKFTSEGDLSVTGTVNGNILTVHSKLTHKYKELNFYNGTAATSALVSDSGSSLNLYAGTNVEFKNENSKLTINANNTWRSISAYKLSTLNDSNTANDTLELILNNTASESLGTNALKFGDEFVYDGDEIKLVWTEINGNTITYKT